MAFGSSVDALLEFYSTCISLLKTSKSRRGDGTAAQNRDDQQRAQLRRSMRSDRAQVRRAYSSGLSESGSRFAKGDARAKSALSRVLKRLTAAITSILQLSGKHQPVLDCESLMLLSNASRVQAIQSCDQLSRRLGSSPSRGSVASPSTRPKRRRHQSSSSASSKSGRPGPSRNSSRQPSTRQSLKERPRQPGKRRNSGPSSPRGMRTHGQSESGTRAAIPKRISLMSTSTYSTKLGEIPERKWRSRYSCDSDSEEYNIPPVYPLKRFEPPAKKSRFLDLFRRRL